jgi:hypothetical protein
MGLSSTSVHIRLPNGASRGALAHVRAAVIAVLGREGEELVADVSRAERRLALQASGRWVSIYDDAGVPDALASALSKALSARALSVTIDDSSALALAAFEAGKTVGRFKRQSGKVPSATASKPFLSWVPARSVRQLDEVLKADEVLLEFCAVNAARLFGITPATAVAQGVDDLDASLLIGFRDRSRPVPTPQSAPARVYGGLYGLHEVEGREGQRCEVFLKTMNDGGATRGLVLSISGPSVDKKHVAPHSLTVLHQLVEVAKTVFTKRGNVFVAEFPSLEIPAKVEARFADYRRQHEAQEASSLLFKVLLDLQRPGSSQLVFTATCGESTVGPVVDKAPVVVSARRRLSRKAKGQEKR